MKPFSSVRASSSFWISLWLGGIVLGLPWPALHADIIDGGHWDLAVAYVGGSWEPHWHNHDDDEELEMTDATIRGIFDGSAVGSLAGVDSPVSRPVGAAWNFTGAGTGEDLFVFPASNPEPELPFLGLGTEEVVAGTFAGNQLTLEFIGIRSGPSGGHFSGFGFFGPTLVPHFSSFDEGLTSAANRKLLSTGSHEHINLAFTKPGLYELEFNAFGNLAAPGNPYTESGTFVARFEVLTAVPEPSSLCLAGIGLAGLASRRRRK
jgi:surface-anchored protein